MICDWIYKNPTHYSSTFFKFQLVIFSFKGMVHWSFSSRSQELSKLQPYKVVSAEYRFVLWLHVKNTYEFSPLPRQSLHHQHLHKQANPLLDKFFLLHLPTTKVKAKTWGKYASKLLFQHEANKYLYFLFPWVYWHETNIFEFLMLWGSQCYHSFSS